MIGESPVVAVVMTSTAALPSKVQGNSDSAVYGEWGFYTSYDGAVAAWAILV
jgi:hypothetical protein